MGIHGAIRAWRGETPANGTNGKRCSGTVSSKLVSLVSLVMRLFRR